jgi:Uma2 family endonuclease
MEHLTLGISDFEKIADRLGSCELINGEIIPMPPGGYEHSLTTSLIFGHLLRHCDKYKTGRVLTNEAGVVTRKNPGTVRGADALYISFKRLPKRERFPGFLRVAPELVAEVKSHDDSWDDMEEKVREYHKIGVELVWVADPKALIVRVYPRGGEPYVLSKKDTITGGKVLPKFKCRVERFFED